MPVSVTLHEQAPNLEVLWLFTRLWPFSGNWIWSYLSCGVGLSKELCINYLKHVA